MDSDYHWLITIGLVTFSVIAVTANFFLLFVFCRRRGLRTVPNRFIINLLVTNLLSSILLIPLLLVNQESYSSLSTLPTTTVYSEEFRNDPTSNTFEVIVSGNVLPIDQNGTNVLCYFAQSTTSFICTASILSILLIGINQYFGVIHSLRYHFYINRCRSSVFIGISWSIALICAILSSLTYSDSSMWHFCKNRPPPSDSVRILNTLYAFSYFFLVILAPFVAICIIYVCIYTAAHQNSERMRRSASAPLNPQIDCTIHVPLKESSHHKDSLPKVHSAPNFSTLDHGKSFVMEEEINKKVNRSSSDRSTNSFISNLKHKISNASVFRYREETRAAKISILVIFLVLVCYVPYGISLVLCSKCIEVNTSQIFNYLSLILLVLSNIISPFLFGYRNKRVKREICKMFNVSNQNHNLEVVERPRRQSTVKNYSFDYIPETMENDKTEIVVENNHVIPEVIVTCKNENDRKSILKRVCNTSNWPSYKKCNFITVPDSCISADARGSFSSASTQMSVEE
ncbi:alpha-1D adrenergic receptor [Diorhabda sublineata]|uniref:alpha-1D adrenergic receptor n=1 Tax=Diorhabda sublineata TaxID=1163346 RepID=UPI0024E05426|nr:alpha-1D adrenergic receptor [Diorhabda sublineata]XP_056641442.1 alpha-1D adrenergic receptor [Diorhabda sublineata]XP_056641449.1 alpha-1D adrenergic receptor [Diorhabda sublineata]XP_056641456.1 alpha-1D adrenergic receptor [Diorhabda sublineata]